MKILSSITAILAIVFLALSAGSVQAQNPVRETPAVIGLVEGGSPQGYIQTTHDQGIQFATAPGGPPRPIAYSQIKGEGLNKAIRFDERVDVLGEARALFSEGKYAEAGDAFGAVVRNYAIILRVPQNFASEALFYQAESYRRAGLYAKVAQVVNMPVAATIESKLNDRYKRDFEFQKLWGLLGENKMSDLETALGVYQEPMIGDAKLLGAPNFKDLPATELAELAFLRAKVFDAKGEKEKALDDYYRTFTLGYGNKVVLAKLAMGAAMQIHKVDPALEKENKQAVSHMQSIAYQFSKRFGKDTMPPDYQRFAERPPMAQMKSGAKEEPAPEGGEAKPEGEGEKPADGKAGKPAEGAKEEAGEKKE